MQEWIMMIGLVLLVGLLVLYVKKREQSNKTKESMEEGKKEAGQANPSKINVKLEKQSKKSSQEPPIKGVDPGTLSLQTQLPAHFLSNSSDVFSGPLENIGNVLNNYEALQEQAAKVRNLAEDASRPLMVVIMGEFKTGKSTFINALLKEEIVTTAVTPATAAVTMLCYGTKQEIIAYYHDGTNESFPYEKLSAISAEGDPLGEKVRSKLSYLEVRLPHPMLKQLTIVDTPGLNADNPLHTKATEDFMGRADLVLWLFSYMNVGTKTAVSALQKIDLEQKPIAIISQIDEYDEEEEDDTLEEFLQKSRQRLGNHVDRVIGVSALLAQDAREDGDEELWQESNWAAIEQLVDKEISAQSGARKTARVLTKLQEIFDDFNGAIAGYKKQYDRAHKQLYSHQDFVNQVRSNQQTLFQFKELFEDYAKNNPLAGMMEVNDLPDYVIKASSLNQYKQTLHGVLEGLIEEKEQIERDFNANQRKIDNHNRDWSRLEEDAQEYNNSGLFGGRPLFDWDGKLEALRNRENRLVQAANRLNERKDEIIQQDEARVARWERADQEAYDLIQDILENLQKTIRKFDDQLNNTDETLAAAEQELEQLDWLEHKDFIYSNIYWNLDMIITAVERNMGYSDGELLLDSKKVEAHMKFLIKTISTAESDQTKTDARIEAPIEEEIYDDLETLLQTDAEEIQLKAGIYRLNGSLPIDRSIKLIGSETGTTKIVSDTSGPVLFFKGEETKLTGITFEYRGTDATNVVTVSSNTFTIENCHFAGGKIDHEEMAQIFDDDAEENPDTGMGLSLRGSGKGKVNECQFYQNVQGVMVNESIQVELSNCQIYQNELVGISFSDNSSGIVKHSELVDNLLGIGIDDTSSVTVANNRFWGNKAAVIAGNLSKLVAESNEMIANSNGAIKATDESTVTASYNYIAYNVAEGIGISDSATANVSYNYVQQHEYGMGAIGASKIQFYGNLSQNNYHGIMFHEEVTGDIRKNKAMDNTINGILIGGNAQLNIEDNELIRNKSGILVIESEHAKLQVNRNKIKNNVNGFGVNDSAECSLEENQIESNEVGVFISGNKPAQLRRNRFIQNEVGISLLDEMKPKLMENTIEYNDNGILYNDRSGGKATENSISHNEFGIVINGQATPSLIQNTVKYNKKDAIQVKQQAAPTIENNVINENGESGIVYFDRAKGAVVFNEISRNKEYGIHFLDEPLTEKRNTMIRNGLGNINKNRR